MTRALVVNQTATFDIELRVGAVQQSIPWTRSARGLASASAEFGQRLPAGRFWIFRWPGAIFKT